MRASGKVEAQGLGRQDSNLGSRDQSPLPYRLATPHRLASLRGERFSAPAAVAEQPHQQHEQHDDGDQGTKNTVTGIATATSASSPCAKATIQAPSRIDPGGSWRPANQ